MKIYLVCDINDNTKNITSITHTNGENDNFCNKIQEAYNLMRLFTEKFSDTDESIRLY